MTRAPPLGLAAATLAALALAGCAKDLDLPPRSNVPAIRSIVPASAWAGQLLFLDGDRLDDDPSANLVSFPGATARGLRFDGTTLVVRVPPDAGSGRISVTNSLGTSAPFPGRGGTPFDYLGLGEPRRRAVSTSRALLHEPRAVFGIGGNAYLDSSLYGGLLRADDPTFATPAAIATAGSPAYGAVYYVVERGTQCELYRVDAATKAVTGPRLLPFRPSQLLVVTGYGVVAFSTRGPDVAAWDPTGLDTILDPTSLRLPDFAAAADAAGGTAVVVGLDDTFTANRVSLVSFAAAPRAGPLPDPALVATLALDDVPARPPLAAAGGSSLAALGLASGDVALFSLGAVKGLTAVVDLFSPSPIGGLAATDLGGPIFLATKPADGLSVGIDASGATPRLVWSVPGASPTHAASEGGYAFVANGGDNDVSVVNLLTGSIVARVAFDVAPGAAGVAYGETMALLPADPAALDRGDELFFPVGGGVPAPPFFPGLVRFPVGTGSPSVVSRAPNAGVVRSSPSPVALWAARGPGTLDAYLDRSWGAPTAAALPGTPLRAAALGSSLALVTDDGAQVTLALVDAAAVVTTSALGASAAVVGVDGVGLLDPGRPWTAIREGDGEHVTIWDATPISTVVPGRQTTAAVFLESGLWLLGGSTPTATTLLGPDLSLYRNDVVLADAIRAVHAVSPNGRLLVAREVGALAGATLLRFYRADPDAGFPQIDQILVPGNVEGLVFDGTGERLWLVTRSPDRVVLVD